MSKFGRTVDVISIFQVPLELLAQLLGIPVPKILAVRVRPMSQLPTIATRDGI